MEENKLPAALSALIDDYLSLQIGEQQVATPYYRNVARVRGELRSLVGKGTPDEIVEEVMIFAKLRGFKISDSSATEIRDFMQKEGIGIDCSGLVAHLLDRWLKVSGNRGIGNELKWPKESLYRTVTRWLRPIEKISAEFLTSPDNTTEISINDAQPGDLIRLRGPKQGQHILMISEVEKNSSNRVVSIQYVHSSPHFGTNNGVKFGEIRIIDPMKGIESQAWEEKDEAGTCPTHEGYLRELEDNRIVRINFFKKLKWKV